jgi:DNA-binding MarR family transcriptional regulator
MDATASSFLVSILQGSILLVEMDDRAAPDHVDGILAQWRRERPDLDASPIGVFGRLSRAERLTDAVLAEGIAEHGLQPGWFDLLAALRRQGSPYELNPTQLTRATLLSSGGTTKRLDRLAEGGLIERRADPDERRGIVVRLTRRGKGVIDRALATHLENERRLLRVFTREERRSFEGLLGILLDGLEGADPPQG